MNIYLKKLIVLVIPLILFTACSIIKNEKYSKIFQILTTSNFLVSNSDIKKIEKIINKQVRVSVLGESGAIISKLKMSKGKIPGDLVLGLSDNNILDLNHENYFEKLAKENVEKKQKELKERIVLDYFVPIDRGFVCLNYDLNWFKRNHLKPIIKTSEIFNVNLRNKSVIPDITSSTTLSFLKKINRFYNLKIFLKKINESKVKIVSDWNIAYRQSFTISGGEYPIVLSYSTSPFFEYQKNKTIKSLNVEDSCEKTIEYGVILKNNKNLTDSNKVLNYFLSKEFQINILKSMSMFPVLESIQIPKDLLKFHTNNMFKSEIDTIDVDEKMKILDIWNSN